MATPVEKASTVGIRKPDGRQFKNWTAKTSGFRMVDHLKARGLKRPVFKCSDFGPTLFISANYGNKRHNLIRNKILYTDIKHLL